MLGIPVTTMLRTAWDLGRVRSRERAISGHGPDASLPGFPLDAFLAGVERFRGERWVTTLRMLAPLADGRAESPPGVDPPAVLDRRRTSPARPQLEVWVDGC